MSALPMSRVVLYKHGVGYFEREGSVTGDTTVALTFKQSEVSDVLKSLTVLDLDGGHIASVSYDSTKPLEQLLAEVSLSIPDQGSLVGLLTQIKGARLRVESSTAKATGTGFGMAPSKARDNGIEGVILGVDTEEQKSGDGITRTVLLSLVTDAGEVRSFPLHALEKFEILDAGLRRDLDYYLRTQLSAKKKDARTFTFFAQGQGERRLRLSYTLEAPVWKATYRILLSEPDTSGAVSAEPLIQGWAVVDNTQDEDWENVNLSLVAGLPVSFVHDLYTPRYIRRPVVQVKETTGVLPPEVEEGMAFAALSPPAGGPASLTEEVSVLRAERRVLSAGAGGFKARAAVSSTPVQTRERKIGDLFEYEIEHPVTIKRNQSALVPIVLRSFEGRPVLLYNKATRAENPMRCVEFKNTTGLTLEGGPVTVLESGSYVGEAMLETTKPDDQRLVPFAVELAVSVLDNVDSHEDRVSRIIIRKGTLKAQHMQVQQTTYALNNKADAEQTIYLDHARGAKEWKLSDTAEPHEITENFWRFRFVLPAKIVTKFVVKQQRVVSQSFGLSDANDQQLAYWIEERYLDAATAELLRQAMQLRQRVAGIEAQIARLEKERDTIHAEQKRIRENLQSLGDRPSEKELRERFVRTLNTQEDRLEQIEREHKLASEERDRLREQINTTLAGLEYETKL
jgi:hypothetical protein